MSQDDLRERLLAIADSNSDLEADERETCREAAALLAGTPERAPGVDPSGPDPDWARYEWEKLVRSESYEAGWKDAMRAYGIGADSEPLPDKEVEP